MSRLSLAALAALAVSLLMSVPAATASCLFDAVSPLARFDASILGSTDGNYIDKGPIPFTYRINPCRAITAIPPKCEAFNATAFQVTDSGECFRVASDKATSTSLIDPKNPARGFRVIYGGGQTCVLTGKPRELQIDFVCARSAPTADNMYVTEDKCNYAIEIVHPAACPVQCPLQCSSRGFCAYDLDARLPRCFCDVGTDGSGCEKTGTPGATAYDALDGGYAPLSSAQTLLAWLCAILGLLVFGAVAMLVYMFRIRAVKPTESGALNAGAFDGEQVVFSSAL